MTALSGATPFQALLAAINRLAHEVNLPLDVAADLLSALDGYAKQRVADATANLQAEVDRLRAELDEATRR